MGERKTALVLSAGGMFGAYQAGAWQAIAERFQPDIVVGASVGALNGWSIASGCSPEHLIEKWRDPQAGAVLRLFPNAGWRNGWFDPEPLRACTEQLISDYTPSTPFGLVMVQMPGLHTRWLRTVLVKHPEVTAAHLQATCSIPLFLPGVTIGDGRYLDGGLLEKLPIWAAVEMGATSIIAIDSLPKVGRWWLRAGTNFARLFKPDHYLPDDLEVTIVSPSEWLGDANDAVFWKRENIDRWIKLGMRDTPDAMQSPPLQASTIAAVG
jgi:NTE family protein